jgi:LPS export ABC transporter protein LptC
MRRTRLRAGLLVVVAAALGGIGYLASRNVVARRARTLDDLGKDFLPQVAQRIQNFRRVKVENGRTVWEITAKDAQFFQEDSQIVVIEPQMTFHLEDGSKKALVQGNEGRLALDGHELTSITLRGAVAVHFDDLQLETEEATYDRVSDRITTPGAVTLRGRTVELRGRGMEVHVGPQRVRLLSDVATTLHADGATS